MLNSKKLLIIPFFVGIILLFAGCDIINPDEQIPAYIEINDIVVNEDASAVTDAWVYINDYLVGSYDLPAHFPVLYNGDVKISVRPGIRVNGIAVTRGYYPFYEIWENDEINLKEGETTVINPVTEYTSGLDIQWDEDFETIALSLEPYDTLTQNFTKTDTVSDSSTGKVGVAEIGVESIFTVQTIDKFDLPTSGAVYLELSYKCDIPFELAWNVENIETGVIYNNRLYQFNTTDEWQHIYIYLTNFVAEYPGDVNRFQFLIGAFNLEDESQYIYVDNIKLIHSN